LERAGYIARHNGRLFEGKVGGPESGFFHPRGLVVDEGGVLYVADTGTSRVVKYGLKMRSRNSEGIPRPVSDTETTR